MASTGRGTALREITEVSRRLGRRLGSARQLFAWVTGGGKGPAESGDGPERAGQVAVAAAPPSAAPVEERTFTGPEPARSLAERLDDYCRAYGENTTWLSTMRALLLPLSDAMADLQGRRADLIASDPNGHGKHYDVVYWMMNEC